MKQGIAVLALVIPASLIVGCGPSDEEKVIGLVKTEVISRFKDPDSAQYRDLKSVKDYSGQWVVCGEVNAKNSLGAYVGYDRFYGRVEGQGTDRKVTMMQLKSNAEKLQMPFWNPSECDSS